MKRNVPLKRSTSLKRGSKPMRKVSTKQGKINREYAKVRREHLLEHPICQVENCAAPAVDIHHRKRRGIHTCEKEWFLSCCRPHHTYIEENGKWSRENGYIID